MYPPEIKIKTFLDSVAYYLLAGNYQGIETNYKRVMHAKREIPASSCPSAIENLMYASGTVSEGIAREEEAQFEALLDRLDMLAEKYETPARTVHRESRFHKKERLGIHGGEWHVVDTDGCFRDGDRRYRICDNAVQYQPIHTEYGDYYPMDRILSSGGKFYDMDFDEVEVLQAGWILPKDCLSNVWP